MWSHYKCGSFWFSFITGIFRTFGNPSHNTFKNRIFPNFTKSNRVASFHAIKSCNNRLFRSFNRLFFWQFWNPIFLVLRIKPQTRFSKNTFLGCQDNFKVGFNLWMFIHSSYKIVDLTLKIFTIFTNFRVTQMRRIFAMHFKIFKISFWLFQFFFKSLDSNFKPVIQPFQLVVWESQSISFMSFFKSLK